MFQLSQIFLFRQIKVRRHFQATDKLFFFSLDNSCLLKKTSLSVALKWRRTLIYRKTLFLKKVPEIFLLIFGAKVVLKVYCFFSIKFILIEGVFMNTQLNGEGESFFHNIFILIPDCYCLTPRDPKKKKKKYRADYSKLNIDFINYKNQ